MIETFEMTKARYDRYIANRCVRTDKDVLLDVCSRASHGTCLDFSRGLVDVAVRHDMDSDCENAVRLAEWEHANGIRATYFVLHTDWYYRYRGHMTRLVLDSLERIASLGHEIGLHNNSVAAMLRGGGQAERILAGELEELRSRGFDIKGAASHGDSENHRADLPNDSVFDECVKPENRRRLDHSPMSRFGIEYEAYHLGHKHYLSDAGGEWRSDPATIKTDGLVVLMHPLYWQV